MSVLLFGGDPVIVVGTTTVSSVGGNSVNDGQWHHVAATYDGGGSGVGSFTVYVDGAVAATDVSPAVTWTSTIQSILGARGDAPGYTLFHTGDLAHVNVYDHELSAVQVQALYLHPDQIFDDVDASISHRWEFEGNLSDSVGSSDFTTGAATYSSGIIGRQADLAASTTLTTPSVGSMNIGAAESFSVAGWLTVSTANPTSDYYLLRKTASNSRLDPGWGLGFKVDSGTPVALFTAKNGTARFRIAAPYTPTPGEPFHLAATFNRTTERMAVFVNGALLSDTYDPGSTFSALGSITNTRPSEIITPAGATGSVNDVRFYDFALEDEAIAELCANTFAGAGIKHRWRFNRGLEDSGNLQDFTANANVTYETGTIGSRVVLPPAESLTTTIDVPTADFAASDSFVVSFWVTSNEAAIASNQNLVRKKSGGIFSTNAGWVLYARGTSGPMEVGCQISDGTSRARIASRADVADGETAHITMVVDRVAQEMRLYKNGVLVTDQVDSGHSAVSAVGDISNVDPIEVGDSGYLGNLEIDDLRIYNRSLSPPEVAGLHASIGNAADGFIHQYLLSNNGNDGVGSADLTLSSGGPTYDGQWVSVPNNASVHRSSPPGDMLWRSHDSFSVAFHLMAPAYNTRTFIIRNKFGTSFSAPGWTMYFEPTNGRFKAKLSDGLASSTIETSAAPAAGTWYHVCLVVDRRTQTHTVYFDGVAVSTAPFDNALITVANPYNTGQPFIIGGDGIEFNLRDARIYNRAITQPEVLWLSTIEPPPIGSVGMFQGIIGTGIFGS